MEATQAVLKHNVKHIGVCCSNSLELYCAKPQLQPSQIWLFCGRKSQVTSSFSNLMHNAATNLSTYLVCDLPAPVRQTVTPLAHIIHYKSLTFIKLSRLISFSSKKNEFSCVIYTTNDLYQEPDNSRRHLLVLPIPASSSVLSGSLLIKHLSLRQAQMSPCALTGIYLSTSESSMDLSSQCSGELGTGTISVTQIKSKAQRLNSALCCFEDLISRIRML